ncbi:hypothetical protein [Streptomyces albus]|nr:hypothetical protein [Streptomyces albus]
MIGATGAGPQRHVTVLVRGERIAAIGSARRAEYLRALKWLTGAASS